MPRKTERSVPTLEADPKIEGYARIPEAIEPLYHKHLSKAAIIVFQTLIRWQIGPNRYSRPVANMSATIGMSEGTVRNALSELKIKGFIRVVEGGHKGHTAVYEIAIKDIASRIGYTKGHGKAPTEGTGEPP